MSDRPTPEALRAFYRLPPDDDALLEECDVTAFKAGGPGGQHKNKTLSAIRLHHRPSGIVVIGRRERSQRRNLQEALGRLRERLKVLLTPPKPRRKTRPSRAAKEKRLEEKRRRSAAKRGRSKGSWDD